MRSLIPDGTTPTRPPLQRRTAYGAQISSLFLQPPSPLKLTHSSSPDKREHPRADEDDGETRREHGDGERRKRQWLGEFEVYSEGGVLVEPAHGEEVM